MQAKFEIRDVTIAVDIPQGCEHMAREIAEQARSAVEQYLFHSELAAYRAHQLEAIELV